MLHAEILTDAQRNLLPLLRQFRGEFGLVGGTAIALHLGHRQSIDFDLFSEKPLSHAVLREKIVAFEKNIQTIIETPEEYTTLIDGVKITLLHYPFHLDYPIAWDDIARLPDLLTLSAMKAYALGRRAKWKDYVDLYFIMEYRHSLREIVGRANVLFGAEFSEKNFRSQLAYFDDVDRSESVIFRPGQECDDRTIEEVLSRLSVSD